MHNDNIPLFVFTIQLMSTYDNFCNKKIYYFCIMIRRTCNKMFPGVWICFWFKNTGFNT